MKDDYEYRLNDPGELETEKAKIKYKKIIIAFIITIIFLIVVIAVGIALYFTLGQNKDNSSEVEEIEIADAYIYVNISTSENKKIKNSFKKGGENYKKEIGNLNNGKDYEENERDNFDVCIPKSLLQNKTKYITIALNIHGGGWIRGDKANVLETCNTLMFQNFINVAMSYTLLGGQYNEYNIFRILDEITAVLRRLKKFLIDKGFDGNKLELLIQGGSAGAHLSLLYSYMIKNPPIPIKLIYNTVAPVTLIPGDFLTTLPDSEPLEDISPEEIKKATIDKTIVPMNGTATGVNMNNTVLVIFMNAWLGRSIDQDFKQIFLDEEKNEINETSEIYQELLKNTSYAYPTNYVTEESIPTLCVYGGKDEEVGVAQYARLKEAFDRNNNSNITLVYFKYGMHNTFYNCTGEYGEKMIEKLAEEIYKHYNKYLDSYNKN